jgi:hypothetical protein
MIFHSGIKQKFCKTNLSSWYLQRIVWIFSSIYSSQTISLNKERMSSSNQIIELTIYKNMSQMLQRKQAIHSFIQNKLLHVNDLLQHYSENYIPDTLDLNKISIMVYDYNLQQPNSLLELSNYLNNIIDVISNSSNFEIFPIWIFCYYFFSISCFFYEIYQQLARFVGNVLLWLLREKI